jgi:hypothetical protein
MGRECYILARFNISIRLWCPLSASIGTRWCRRPRWYKSSHQLEHRIQAHILVAFLAYRLQVTLRPTAPLAPDPTPRAMLDKLAAIRVLDVHSPTTDGRTLIPSRYTEATLEQRLRVN